MESKAGERSRRGQLADGAQHALPAGSGQVTANGSFPWLGSVWRSGKRVRFSGRGGGSEGKERSLKERTAASWEAKERSYRDRLRTEPMTPLLSTRTPEQHRGTPQ